MHDAWEYIKDRWEWDSAWRDQIVLALILGAVGLGFALMEIGARAKWQPPA